MAEHLDNIPVINVADLPPGSQLISAVIEEGTEEGTEVGTEEGTEVRTEEGTEVRTEDEEDSVALNKYLRLFKERVINADSTFQHLFSKETKAFTMRDGLKALQLKMFSLILECFGPEKVFGEALFKQLMFTAEAYKPGIYAMAGGRKRSYGQDSPLHTCTGVDQLTSITKNWKLQYTKWRLTSTVHGGYSKTHGLQPGKRTKRKGRNTLLNYAMSSWDMQSSNLVPLDDKSAINKLLKAVSPGLWTRFCPHLLDDIETLKNQVSYLFSSPGEGYKTENVKPIDFSVIKTNLPVKLDLFKEAVEAQHITLGPTYSTIIHNPNAPDRNLGPDLTFLTEGQKQEGRVILAIRKFGFTNGGERATILIDDEIPNSGEVNILVKTEKAANLEYEICVEGKTLFKFNNLVDALIGYFVILFASGIEYMPKGEFFGQLLELYLFDREQTSRATGTQVAKWKIFKKIYDERNPHRPLPPLSINPTKRNQ